jgi:dTDP-4-amino-4,6-dideoxygalactose transaminase
VAEGLATRSCSLPIGPWQSEDEITRVAGAVQAFGQDSR